jgi:hypothetical protein
MRSRDAEKLSGTYFTAPKASTHLFGSLGNAPGIYASQKGAALKARFISGCAIESAALSGEHVMFGRLRCAETAHATAVETRLWRYARTLQT